MRADDLQYVLFALAALVLVLALSRVRHAQAAGRARTWSTFAAAAMLLAASFGVGAFAGADATSHLIQGFALLAMAIGFTAFGSESQRLAELAEQQRVDVHTGLPNKRAFLERLAGEHSRTKRTGRSYAIAIYEIDDYDKLSDADKDNGMRLLAKTLDEIVRNTDAIARIGERHIAVMMVDTEAEGGMIGVERARDGFFFASCGHDAAAPVTRPMTVSVGIAAFSGDTVEGYDVVRNAELALYRMRLDREEGIRLFRTTDYDRPADTLIHAV